MQMARAASARCALMDTTWYVPTSNFECSVHLTLLWSIINDICFPALQTSDGMACVKADQCPATTALTTASKNYGTCEACTALPADLKNMVAGTLYFKDTSTNMCVAEDKCPKGTYPDKATASCVKCPIDNCEDCAGNKIQETAPTTCTTCLGGFIINVRRSALPCSMQHLTAHPLSHIHLLNLQSAGGQVSLHNLHRNRMQDMRKGNPRCL